jgi:hypothetical protein
MLDFGVTGLGDLDLGFSEVVAVRFTAGDGGKRLSSSS